MIRPFNNSLHTTSTIININKIFSSRCQMDAIVPDYVSRKTVAILVKQLQSKCMLSRAIGSKCKTEISVDGIAGLIDQDGMLRAICNRHVVQYVHVQCNGSGHLIPIRILRHDCQLHAICQQCLKVLSLDGIMKQILVQRKGICPRCRRYIQCVN